MAKKPLPLRIDEGLLARVDERRRALGQTRTLFVERALESALRSTVPSAVSEGRVEVTFSSEDGSVVRQRQVSPKLPAGVKTARDLAMERQAALNKAKGS